MPLSDIAPDLQHAVIAIEDHRFSYHPGIDPIGLARAVVRDIRGSGRVEGGSTLTQQLARTLFLSNVRIAVGAPDMRSKPTAGRSRKRRSR